MSPDYTGSPFYPQEKNFVGGIYIYIYVYVGLYMCIWGLYIFICVYMGFIWVDHVYMIWGFP